MVEVIMFGYNCLGSKLISIVKFYIDK